MKSLGIPSRVGGHCGPLVRWSAGPLQSAGPLVTWSAEAGPLVPWSSGLLWIQYLCFCFSLSHPLLAYALLHSLRESSCVGLK